MISQQQLAKCRYIPIVAVENHPATNLGVIQSLKDYLQTRIVLWNHFG